MSVPVELPKRLNPSSSFNPTDPTPQTELRTFTHHISPHIQEYIDDQQSSFQPPSTSNHQQTNDVVLNKLPQNYFMNNEDDSDDMEEMSNVISGIQNMRNQIH